MDKTLAKFFYQQCAGTTTGHMANIPNNPVLFALMSAHSGTTGNLEACRGRVCQRVGGGYWRVEVKP